MAENQTDAPHETMDLAVWSPFRDLRFQAPAAPDPQKVWIWAQSHSNLPMWRTATWRLVGPPEEVLDDLSELEDNWNGEGSLAPTREIVETARRVIEGLQQLPPSDITPNENGTILFEWRYGAEYASLEVGATKYAFMLRNRIRNRFRSGLVEELPPTLGLEIAEKVYWRLQSALPAGQGWALNVVAG